MIPEVVAVILSCVGGTAVMAVIKGIQAWRGASFKYDRIVLETLEGEAKGWRSTAEVTFEVNQKLREILVGQRILPVREPPILKKAPPPPPPRNGGMPLPKQPEPPEKPVCAHVFRHPVFDVWGTEIAGICISCTAQVTNEEWVKVGW
jgi:hypothetical protein